MDLWEQATQRPGAWVSRWWWEQTGIDLKGAREKAAAAATEPKTEADSDLESEYEPERVRRRNMGGEVPGSERV